MSLAMVMMAVLRAAKFSVTSVTDDRSVPAKTEPATIDSDAARTSALKDVFVVGFFLK